MSFYKVPPHIFNPIAKRGFCSGSVLLPTDYDGQLKPQIKASGIDDIRDNTYPAAVQDPEWWTQYDKDVDWVVAITQGLKEETEWVLEHGVKVARCGVCVLDRLSLAEPTRGRHAFLARNLMTNLIILSPRPSFRADGKKLKDSVTSAWFVFRENAPVTGETKVEFEVGWQRPAPV